MLVETVKLSKIVTRYIPELAPSLKRVELDTEIVLRDGLEKLETQDAIEIIKFSISELQKDAYFQ
ncbi:MAG: hypothetical protein A2189_04770 [Paenibacillus sp. RIFOXYA1_FULL_44_5]|nr:MAG: hypothetical protein A2189_04770 [Paenibacillus sp. RIFOXYA1_FULL_44_5]